MLLLLGRLSGSDANAAHRQSSNLPVASFRFHLATDILAVQLALPLAMCVENFHLQDTRLSTTVSQVALASNAPCLAHQKKPHDFHHAAFVFLPDWNYACGRCVSICTKDSFSTNTSCWRVRRRGACCSELSGAIFAAALNLAESVSI